MLGQANQNNAPAPSLCRDTMELLFRNVLANAALVRGSGSLVKRVAMSNKVARDSLVRVTRRFRRAVLTSGKVTLIRDQETATVTTMQFSWLLRMDMLRFETFEISCSSSNDCNKLSQTPYMPNTYPITAFAYQLAAAIIKSNAETLKVLEGLPIGTFNEALPALELDTFVFTPLDHCSISVFEYDVSRCLPPRTRISLDPLVDLDATEIFRKFSDLEGFQVLTTHATNNFVEIVCLEAERIRLDTTDIDRLLRFFPKLVILDICANIDVQANVDNKRVNANNLWELNEIKQYLAQTHGARPLQVNVHSVFHLTVEDNVEWTELSAQAVILELRNLFANGPPKSHEVEVLGNLYMTFHRVSESDTRDAEKKATELGLRREDVNGTTLFKGRISFAPGHSMNFEYTAL
ncbi:hypothetical protein AAVH_17007 [Aphelenchoides avenae]|nr:hypothetical protein AAVH_17007 [Aphelenchus avenae]